MCEIILEEVPKKEIDQLHNMQVQSFMPLYEKYHDEESPAIEPVEKVRGRAEFPGRKYYFIVKDGERVGAINIGNKQRDNDNTIFYISPLFILPEYQNQGIGYAAIRKVFEMYPEATTWRLATILQEPANCHLYEKCGFQRTGEETDEKCSGTKLGRLVANREFPVLKCAKEIVESL